MTTDPLLTDNWNRTIERLGGPEALAADVGRAAASLVSVMGTRRFHGRMTLFEGMNDRNG
jgi:hypothetical protein